MQILASSRTIFCSDPETTSLCSLLSIRPSWLISYPHRKEKVRMPLLFTAPHSGDLIVLKPDDPPCLCFYFLGLIILPKNMTLGDQNMLPQNTPRKCILRQLFWGTEGTGMLKSCTSVGEIDIHVGKWYQNDGCSQQPLSARRCYPEQAYHYPQPLPMTCL